jgi:hypothetical protein
MSEIPISDEATGLVISSITLRKQEPKKRQTKSKQKSKRAKEQKDNKGQKEKATCCK